MTALLSVIYPILGIIGLLAAIAAVVVSLLSRKQNQKRATYAAIGFGLFAVSALFAFIFPFLTGPLIRSGSGSIGAYQALSLVNSVVQALLRIGALGLLLLALFKTDGASQSPSPGQYAPQQQQYQQAPQQYQVQQQPGQYPGQPQQQYPGQQPPQQQYPYQKQPPQQGQQYPGQGGGQQYPGQGGQYPGQGY